MFVIGLEKQCPVCNRCSINIDPVDYRDTAGLSCGIHKGLGIIMFHHNIILRN